MANRIDILTVFIIVIAAYLLYTLVSSPETCDHKTENYTKKHKKSVHHKKKESCKTDTKPSAEIKHTDGAKFMKSVLANNSKTMTSKELLPSEQNGWEKYGCFTVDYNPSQSYNRPTPLVPDSQRNMDLQYGRPVFVIKKKNVGPWNCSTIATQARGYDDDSLGSSQVQNTPARDVVVVTPAP